MKNSCNLQQPAFPSHLCFISLISSSILPAHQPKKKLHRNAFISKEEKVRLVFFCGVMVVAWCRIRNLFLMMSTVVIVSAEQTGSSVCFCSAVTFACSEKLSQHQITPKDFQNKVFPQLDREDNLYYEDDEKIQWKARSVSIPPNKISLFLQDLRHALKRCQARLKFKEQRAVLTG